MDFTWSAKVGVVCPHDSAGSMSLLWSQTVQTSPIMDNFLTHALRKTQRSALTLTVSPPRGTTRSNQNYADPAGCQPNFQACILP
eukprot:888284-Pelagomonas_calceolata.AAC.2